MNLLSKKIFLNIKPKKRLGFNDGAKEIKNQEFFNEINWEKVYKKQYNPPFKPKTEGNYDLRHFDKVSYFYLI